MAEITSERQQYLNALNYPEAASSELKPLLLEELRTFLDKNGYADAKNWDDATL